MSSSNFDWREHLSEEYGDEPIEVTEVPEQYSGSNVDLDGKTPIPLGSSTFYVTLPEKLTSDVRLLSGIDSPEEAYRLTELLRCLKQRKQVMAADGRDVRREFLAALKKQEAQLASGLRKRLKQEVKN